MDSLPDTEKCGSLMCGRDNFMFAKKPLIASTTDLTLVFAASIGVIMAFLIPFQTVDAVDLILLNTDVTVDLTALNTPETLDLTSLIIR